MCKQLSRHNHSSCIYLPPNVPLLFLLTIYLSPNLAREIWLAFADVWPRQGWSCYMRCWRVPSASGSSCTHHAWVLSVWADLSAKMDPMNHSSSLRQRVHPISEQARDTDGRKGVLSASSCQADWLQQGNRKSYTFLPQPHLHNIFSGKNDLLFQS